MPVSNIALLQGRRATLQAKPRLAPGWGQTGEEDLYLMLHPHSALSDFIGNRAGQWHWNTLSFRIRMALGLARDAVPTDAEVCGKLQLAAAYLTRIKERWEETGKWTTTGPEELILGDALHFADQLQKLVTRTRQAVVGRKVIQTHLKDLSVLGITKAQATRWLPTK